MVESMRQQRKVVIINCSPRQNGNCHWVASRISDRLKDQFATHLIHIHDLSIHPCGDCDRFCEKTGRCAQRDDMDILYSLFDTAAAVILATPVYFYSFPGYAKIMIDRCQPYWVQKKEKHPPRAQLSFSAAVMIGATGGEKLFYGMKQIFHSFSWVLGVAHVDQSHILEIRRVEARGEIEKHMDEVEKFIEMAQKQIPADADIS